MIRCSKQQIEVKHHEAFISRFIFDNYWIWDLGHNSILYLPQKHSAFRLYDGKKEKKKKKERSGSFLLSQKIDGFKRLGHSHFCAFHPSIWRGITGILERNRRALLCMWRRNNLLKRTLLISSTVTFLKHSHFPSWLDLEEEEMLVVCSDIEMKLVRVCVSLRS